MRIIPWWDPQLTGHEAEHIKRVLDANYINDGDVTTEFERAIAAVVGAEHAVAVPSGTMAITAALLAVGVRPGDEVIVPDVTFIATANAATLIGAKAVLVDVDRVQLTVDPDAVERAITPRTKAVVPVHVSGRGAAMEPLCRLAAKHGIEIVEDAAEALCSTHQGRALGTWGRAGCLSFSPNKAITTGQGGVVLTNEAAIADRLRELKDQGRPRKGTGGDDLHPSLGFNFKVTNLQAAVGLAQLGALQDRLQRQRRLYAIYKSEMSNLDGLTLPGFDIAGGEQPLWTDALVEDRNALDDRLRSKGMHCRRFWFPLHTQGPYQSSDRDFPNSTYCSARALWLPSAYTLTDQDAFDVCAEIHAWARERS